ncbi:MAG: putative lipid II flippase FtsW [Oscillospiraceae bacterium]|nr:putative lipid II flippase FtsW [Oscillospiraceae bacterium]
MTREKKKQKAKLGGFDSIYLILVLVLLGIGLVMMFSASYPSAYYEGLKSTHYFMRQLGFAALGLVVMFAVSFIDYRRLRALSPLLMGVSIVLLVMVLIIGTGNYGEKRWLNLGVRFQPSEIAKIAVTFFFASYISTHSDKMRTFRYGVLPFVIVLGVLCGLMFLEPHLSGAILIAGIGAVIMFVGGTHWGWFAGVIGLGVTGGILAITQLDYAQARLRVWLDPFVDPKGKGWQAVQSLYAIGSGGLFGLGFGNSRQKYLYLPEAHNDFIFAVVCEELGFIGACIIMLLFALLILRGFWIATRAKDQFGALLVVGITAQIALQTLLNIGVVTGVLPVTGASLPFFSYGGTSLLLLLAEVGIVLSVSRRMKTDAPTDPKQPEESMDGEEAE